MPLHIALDRELPVSIGAQLKGQIEYSIVAGTLRAGERLPSVREMATAVGIAPVTVSHVYAALKRDGMITMQAGMGTYVVDNGDRPRAGEALGDLHGLVDAMVLRALDGGFTPAQISQMVTARLAGHGKNRAIVAMVAPFSHATAVYAREVAALLADLPVEVTPHTLQGVRAGREERERVRAADLVLTVANRVKEVQDLLGPGHPPVRGLTFVAHPDTIARLRALPRGLALGVITTFAEFLPTMLRGIEEHTALDRPPLCAALSDAARVRAVLAEADTVVFASGSEAALARLPRDKPAIEYLHTPEPNSVEAVRPLLRRLSGAVARFAPEKGGDSAHDETPKRRDRPLLAAR
jgi:DNA-binding transcriptional regulator YhcF (GntR family)